MEKKTKNTRFSDWQNRDDRMSRAAAIAVNDCLGVKAGEQIMIVTNPDPDVSEISTALYDAVLAVDARPVILYQPVKTQLDFTEPLVLQAFRAEPEVVISMSAEKIGKDEEGIRKPYEYKGETTNHYFHYIMDSKKVTRAFWSPSVTAELFMKTVPVDYSRMRIECAAVAEKLDAAETITITNRNGTDITFSVQGRKAMKDDGDFTKPGAGGNLPAGESFISPVVGTAQGTIVFDGSISVFDGVLVLEKPISVRVEEGFVTSVEGGPDADILQETLERAKETALRMEKEGQLPAGSGAEYAKNAGNIGELGVGLNPEADITGNMLIDEKAYRTCHIAIGSNCDEDAEALIHLDGLITEPTITGRGPNNAEIMIMNKGDLIRD